MGENIEMNGCDALILPAHSKFLHLIIVSVFQHCNEFQPSEFKNQFFSIYFLLAFYVLGSVLSINDKK